MFHSGLHHEPTDQKIQYNVSRYLELDGVGTSAAQTLFHPLVHFQFSIGRSTSQRR